MASVLQEATVSRRIYHAYDIHFFHVVRRQINGSGRASGRENRTIFLESARARFQIAVYAGKTVSARCRLRDAPG
ncbi:hypothetical protein D3C84_957060 [compost metagenome]